MACPLNLAEQESPANTNVCARQPCRSQMDFDTK